MPSSLNCPTCGAPAPSATAARCAYCGSTLTTVGCPSCFGVMFAGMEFCPHCGSKASRVVDESAPPLVCPGCTSGMRRVTIGHTAMYECTACVSLWLDAATFTELCTTREQRGAVTAFIDVGKVAPAPRTVPIGKVRYVPCPVCKQIMNRQNFGWRSGVVIDVCKGHGVWFEQDELPAALRFIDTGGFERARRAKEAEEVEAKARLFSEFNEFNAAAQDARHVTFAVHIRRGDGSVDARAADASLSELLKALFS